MASPHHHHSDDDDSSYQRQKRLYLYLGTEINTILVSGFCESCGHFSTGPYNAPCACRGPPRTGKECQVCAEWPRDCLIRVFVGEKECETTRAWLAWARARRAELAVVYEVVREGEGPRDDASNAAEAVAVAAASACDRAPSSATVQAESSCEAVYHPSRGDVHASEAKCDAPKSEQDSTTTTHGTAAAQQYAKASETVGIILDDGYCNDCGHYRRRRPCQRVSFRGPSCFCSEWNVYGPPPHSGTADGYNATCASCNKEKPFNAKAECLDVGKRLADAYAVMELAEVKIKRADEEEDDACEDGIANGKTASSSLSVAAVVSSSSAPLAAASLSSSLALASAPSSASPASVSDKLVEEDVFASPPDFDPVASKKEAEERWNKMKIDAGWDPVTNPLPCVNCEVKNLRCESMKPECPLCIRLKRFCLYSGDWLSRSDGGSVKYEPRLVVREKPLTWTMRAKMRAEGKTFGGASATRGEIVARGRERLDAAMKRLEEITAASGAERPQNWSDKFKERDRHCRGNLTPTGPSDIKHSPVSRDYVAWDDVVAQTREKVVALTKRFTEITAASETEQTHASTNGLKELDRPPNFSSAGVAKNPLDQRNLTPMEPEIIGGDKSEIKHSPVSSVDDGHRSLDHSFKFPASDKSLAAQPVLGDLARTASPEAVAYDHLVKLDCPNHVEATSSSTLPVTDTDKECLGICTALDKDFGNGDACHVRNDETSRDAVLSSCSGSDGEILAAGPPAPVDEGKSDALPGSEAEAREHKRDPNEASIRVRQSDEVNANLAEQPERSCMRCVGKGIRCDSGSPCARCEEGMDFCVYKDMYSDCRHEWKRTPSDTGPTGVFSVKDMYDVALGFHEKQQWSPSFDIEEKVKELMIHELSVLDRETAFRQMRNWHHYFKPRPRFAFKLFLHLSSLKQPDGSDFFSRSGDMETWLRVLVDYAKPAPPAIVSPSAEMRHSRSARVCSTGSEASSAAVMTPASSAEGVLDEVLDPECQRCVVSSPEPHSGFNGGRRDVCGERS